MSTRPERITGPRREKMRAEMLVMYHGKASIRAIADHYDRSYGATHRMLSEALYAIGGEFRPRGGAVRKGPGETTSTKTSRRKAKAAAR